MAAVVCMLHEGSAGRMPGAGNCWQGCYSGSANLDCVDKIAAYVMPTTRTMLLLRGPVLAKKAALLALMLLSAFCTSPWSFQPG